MTRLEELEEQSRHLMDKIRTKRRKVEDIKNDLKVINSYMIYNRFFICCCCFFSFQRTERALEELINDQTSTDDINREKRQQVKKLENDVKDMDAKLTRADKSV